MKHGSVTSASSVALWNPLAGLGRLAVSRTLVGLAVSPAGALPARGQDVPFTEQVISTDADSAWSVFATDLDGDGDADVRSASWNDGKIARHENLSPRGFDSNCDGGTQNPVFLREHADITGCRIVLPREREAVLLGSAMLGAAASGHYDSLPVAMAAMNAEGTSIVPGPTGKAGVLVVRDYHAAKHDVFLRMYEDQQAYRSLMRSVGSE